MTTPLPPASLWEQPQFQVVGVIVLVVFLLGLGMYRFWSDWKRWQADENGRREAERETQRKWQAEQNLLREAEQNKRDAMWRELLGQIQSAQSKDTKMTNELLTKLVERMDAVTVKLGEHDTWARTAIDGIKDR